MGILVFKKAAMIENRSSKFLRMTSRENGKVHVEIKLDVQISIQTQKDDIVSRNFDGH